LFPARFQAGFLAQKIAVVNPASCVAPAEASASTSLTSYSQLLEKIGSPGRIRTIDQPVNSRLLYR
jgi:hypothetical protein